MGLGRFADFELEMARQDSGLAHSKLGHQRRFAVNQHLPLNPFQGRTA